MTTRKITVVTMLAMEGVVLGVEIRVALQVMLRIEGWDVGASIVDMSVLGVYGGM